MSQNRSKENIFAMPDKQTPLVQPRPMGAAFSVVNNFGNNNLVSPKPQRPVL